MDILWAHTGAIGINPIHPIGNSLKKRKSMYMYIALTPSIKPSI